MDKVSRNDKLEIVLGLAIAVSGISDGMLDDDLSPELKERTEEVLKMLLVETTRMMVSEEFPKECAESEEGVDGVLARFANKAVKMGIFMAEIGDGDEDDTDS